jgi:Mg2+-importing ATPase
MLRFVQDYRAYLASESLRHTVTNVDVWRDGQLRKVPGDELVVGDKVLLGSGTVVPADLYLLRSKDLFVAQSVFTGESVLVEKKAGADTCGAPSTDLTNICLMGASVISGTAEAVVIKTGNATYLGHIAAGVEEGKGQTAFEKGLSQVTQTLVKYMGFVVVVVFIINGVVKQDWLQAFMFSLSVAVGITPGQDRHPNLGFRCPAALHQCTGRGRYQRLGGRVLQQPFFHRGQKPD